MKFAFALLALVVATEATSLEKHHHRNRFGKRRIYDADGDGVEDNVEKTRDELDRFYIPQVFGPAEEMHNTHHGNLPGHVRMEEYEAEPQSFVQRIRF